MVTGRSTNARLQLAAIVALLLVIALAPSSLTRRLDVLRAPVQFVLAPAAKPLSALGRILVPSRPPCAPRPGGRRTRTPTR